MNVLISIIIIESLLILTVVSQMIKVKKVIKRLIQENAVMWEYLKEKKN